MLWPETELIPSLLVHLEAINRCDAEEVNITCGEIGGKELHGHRRSHEEGARGTVQSEEVKGEVAGVVHKGLVCHVKQVQEAEGLCL